jgi:hypothetical protein
VPVLLPVLTNHYTQYSLLLLSAKLCLQGHREGTAVRLAIYKMGDNSPETKQQSESRQKDEEYARDRYFRTYMNNLYLNEDSIHWISNHIDCFVSQSRGNQSVTEMTLRPHAFKGHDDGFWDKVGQAVGNLQELKTISLSSHHEKDNGFDRVSIPDWGELVCILSHVHVRQNVQLQFQEENCWDEREMQALARAISRGKPAITSFNSHFAFPPQSLDELYSALATLPSLESVWIGTTEPEQQDVSALDNPEIMTELLRAASLRSVYFHHFHFDHALCQATANALGEGTAITSLTFTDCSFSAGECAVMMANAFSRNTSLTEIDVSESCDETLHNALTTVDLGAILRLNKAGRRYLAEDGSSISKGVKVLSAVSNEINSVFLHLLENPRLCERNTVEVASDTRSTDNTGGSASLANHVGKGEHGRASSTTTKRKRKKAPDECKSLQEDLGPDDSYKAWEKRVRKILDPLKVNERELTLALIDAEDFEVCINGIPTDGFDEEKYSHYFYGSVSLLPGVEKDGYLLNAPGSCGPGLFGGRGPSTDWDEVAKHLLRWFQGPPPPNLYSLYIFFWPIADDLTFGDRWEEVAGRFASSKEVGPLTLPALDPASLAKVVESLHTLVFADGGGDGADEGGDGADEGGDGADEGDDGADETKMVCKIIKRGQEGEEDNDIGFIVLKSRTKSFADARQAIADQGVPVSMDYMFSVPNLGPISVIQESMLGPMLALLESSTSTSSADVGDGSFANPVKVFLAGAPVL